MALIVWLDASTLLLATFIWWIIPGLLVKSGKKWDCTGTLPGLLVFYRGGDLAGNTAKLHQASTGTLPGLSGKVLAIYQDFTVIKMRIYMVISVVRTSDVIYEVVSSILSVRNFIHKWLHIQQIKQHKKRSQLFVTSSDSSVTLYHI
ncbi:hypothetical protein JOM56_014906 [Amanita muscaria]